MRKLIYGINISLDGCCDHTKFGGADDVHNYFRELLKTTDLVIYGRKTYDLMVPFWPEVAEAQSMDETSTGVILFQKPGLLGLIFFFCNCTTIQ